MSGNTRTRSHLRLSLGQDNPTYQKLVNVRFTPGATIHGPGIDNSRVYAQARHSGIQSSVALLKAARGEVELMVGSKSDTSAPDTLTTAPGGTRVFIVHGHDDARKLQVAALVRDLTGVKATILSEYPNQGDTIIEKLERAASEAAYAIVIASADDVGGTKDTDSASLAPRARQNVIFELGYFIAKLGRNRAALMVEEGVEIPSDAQGVVYIPLDPNEGWKLPLARELNAAGVAVDFGALAG
ncbi:nucleotide-binding protein [Gordonia sp. (in: high G+C Gram-positive bacteria)]|uniref:nucleotide-binding protein n=1 Tax=Gordonia sp. (in: high G+C Gram-positive bacteria) TaxID=84139 RepID=UPI00257EC3E7|nr:nucleotide-binding protein [Gordonia sp. (in: high G+C Gram-positive bacteria)]